MTADLIIMNARVLTMDPDHPRATAVAVGAARILAVGTDSQVMAHAGQWTRMVDAGGATLLPGFVESHAHLLIGASELDKLHLGSVQGAEALSRAFRVYADTNPDAPLLIAHGAGYDILPDPLTRQDLDAVSPDRPIAIMAADHHTVWANTLALDKAGLLYGADMPHGHEVVLAPDGTATGELREFEAFAAILALGGQAHLQLGIATGEEPDPSPDDAQRAADMDLIRAGLAHAARHGITSIVNMDGNRYTLDLLHEIERDGSLTARVKVPFHFKPHMDLTALDRATSMTQDFASDWLGSGFVKMFMDGVVDSRTAYMLQDYPGQPGHRAEPLFDPARFNAICIEADRRGLQIAVHAIGDAAVRQTADGYQAAAQTNGPRDSRHRIEHIELIDRADVPRLATLGITASIQPSHVPGAMDFPTSTMSQVFHRDRWQDAYLCASLVQTGARVAFASDWPVADISVLRGIQAAVTRQPFDGAQDQRLPLLDVLAAFTSGGAWAAHLDHLTGKITPGLAADLVLLGADIEAVPADRIGQIPVVMTIAGGRIVHQQS